MSGTICAFYKQMLQNNSYNCFKFQFFICVYLELLFIELQLINRGIKKHSYILTYLIKREMRKKWKVPLAALAMERLGSRGDLLALVMSVF